MKGRKRVQQRPGSRRGGEGDARPDWTKEQCPQPQPQPPPAERERVERQVSSIVCRASSIEIVREREGRGERESVDELSSPTSLQERDCDCDCDRLPPAFLSFSPSVAPSLSVSLSLSLSVR